MIGSLGPQRVIDRLYLGSDRLTRRYVTFTLNDSENYLPAPVSAVQPLVRIADFFQRRYLVDEGAYLAALDERAHLLQACSLAREEHV